MTNPRFTGGYAEFAVAQAQMLSKRPRSVGFVERRRGVYLKDDARWLELRAEPRFKALLERLHLTGLGEGASAP